MKQKTHPPAKISAIARFLSGGETFDNIHAAYAMGPFDQPDNLIVQTYGGTGAPGKAVISFPYTHWNNDGHKHAISAWLWIGDLEKPPIRVVRGKTSVPRQEEFFAFIDWFIDHPELGDPAQLPKGASMSDNSYVTTP